MQKGSMFPQVSEKTRSHPPMNFWTNDLNRYFRKAEKGSKYEE